MPLSKDDRIAFSLQIVSADSQVKDMQRAKTLVAANIAKMQKLDDANKNLFDPVNALVTAYHGEYGKLDGIVRTSITEQDIQDSAAKKLPNHFFPNDLNTVVPSLVPFNNVWVKVKPFALTYAIGKNYTEGYGSTQKEADLINPVLTLITSAAAFTDIQNTTGQRCLNGTCSLPQYTDQTSCTMNGGVWTPGPDIISTYADVVTLKNDLVAAVNAVKSFLLTEVASIVTNDPDSGNQALNNAAINNINNVIIPALDTWLAYVDFNTAHGQTTCAGFNSYNSNLLAPTKLHSTQLAALQAALNTRLSFVTTRTGQLATILGTIAQDLNTGDITSSSGLYGKRYNVLLLRLNLLGGSLVDLYASQSATGAQDAIISNLLANKATYMSVVPTSIFKAPGNGTATIALVDTSFLNPGDVVYIIAEGQEELVRGVKSVAADRVVLSDIVPAKYVPVSKARLYKDLT